MDIDLRPQFIVANSSVSVSTAATTHPRQGLNTSCTFFSNKQNIDLNSKFTSINITKTTTAPTNSNFFINVDDDNLLTTTSAKNVATSSPKVSFKIQKIFNKLEKSTENLLSPTTPPSAASAGNVKNDESCQVSKDLDEDGKKRSLAPIKDEEPLAKKSKSAKIDA